MTSNRIIKLMSNKVESDIVFWINLVKLYEVFELQI